MLANLLTTLHHWFVILRGTWRLTWGLCPQCNSDAPATDGCPVCQAGLIPYDCWEQRWIKELMNQPL